MDIHRKSIPVPPSTHIYYNSIPPDAYPINPTNRNTFQIEASSSIILPIKTLFQDFENYIQSMPKGISKLISNFTTNPLSKTLVYYIQQQTSLYIY